MNFDQLMSSLSVRGPEVSLDVPGDWLQGRTVFGGLQGALMVKAMRLQVPAEALLRSLQITFVGPVPEGTVVATARILRQGKSATHVQGEIVANGQVCMTAVAIFGALRDSAVEKHPRAPDCPKTPETLTSLPFIAGVTPAFTQNVEMRWGKGKPPFFGAEDASAQIYVRINEVATFTEAHLVAACDIIPPPILATLKKPTAASSMNWQLEVLCDPSALSGSEWLRVDAELHASNGGYSWNTAHVWSENGELVAISHQCAAIFG